VGSATGVAVATALLETRLQSYAGRSGAALYAYMDCFRIMMLVSLAMLPGILLFRSDRVEAVD
jgi:hypothetical protein